MSPASVLGLLAFREFVPLDVLRSAEDAIGNYLLAFDSGWLHAIVTAALAGAIAHILFLIRDLDDAFDGDGQVARTPFEHARKNFERPARKVDVDAVLPAGEPGDHRSAGCPGPFRRRTCTGVGSCGPVPSSRS